MSQPQHRGDQRRPLYITYPKSKFKRVFKAVGGSLYEMSLGDHRLTRGLCTGENMASQTTASCSCPGRKSERTRHKAEWNFQMTRSCRGIIIVIVLYLTSALPQVQSVTYTSYAMQRIKRLTVEQFGLFGPQALNTSSSLDKPFVKTIEAQSIIEEAMPNEHDKPYSRQKRDTRTDYTEAGKTSLDETTEVIFTGMEDEDEEAFLGAAITVEPPVVDCTDVPATTVSTSSFLSWGADAGDTFYAGSSLSSRLTSKISLSSGLQIFCSAFDSLYISASGYISFGQPYEAVGFSSLPSNQNLYAPYFANMGACDTCGIYYHHYTSSEASASTLISQANSYITTVYGTSITVTNLYVITWFGMHPEPVDSYFESCPETRGIVFQAIIVTDGTKTFGINKYSQNYFNTEPLGEDIHIGYYFGDTTETSFLSGTTGAQGINTLTGDTSVVGTAVIALYDTAQVASDGSVLCDAAEINCVNFLASTFSLAGYDLPACPCNAFQAYTDNYYELVYLDSSQICYEVVLSSPVTYSNTEYEVRQRCCFVFGPDYIDSEGRPNGPLITQPMDGYSPGIAYVVDSDDSNGYQYCCGDSTTFCYQFYDYRPVDGCDTYVTPAFGLCNGDPHITTVDGFDYTFNGKGEYWLVYTTDNVFSAQARTGVPVNNENTQATVFTAFVFKEDGGDKLVVTMDTARENMQIVVGTEDVTSSFLTNTAVKTKVYNNNKLVLIKDQLTTVDSFTAVFSTAWSARITKGEGLLNIEPSFPVTGKGKVTGLLGTFNDDNTDDLQPPSGSALSDTSSESDIFSNFGELWRTTDATSMFPYSSGETWATYNPTDFIPTFDPCDTSEKRAQAEVTCKSTTARQCIFDYCATGDEKIAEQTKADTESFQTEEVARINSLPVLSLSNTTINVVVGQSYTIEVSATDSDNDTTTIVQLGTLPGGTFSNGVYSFTMASTDPVTLGFVASDDQGASSAEKNVIINACSGCSGNGDCDFTDLTKQSAYPLFALARCKCKLGWHGDNCETDYDACSESPCAQWTGANCTDLTPDQVSATGREFSCDCPDGYSTVSGLCVDIDECTGVANTCQQNCVNTPGSFTCTCNSTYVLNVDQQSCDDVDECTLNTHNCQQVCNNTVGGFDCDCFPGYTLDANGRTCTKDPELVCSNPCTGGFCVLVGTDSVCRCPVGYQLSSSGDSCEDVDECLNPSTHSCTDICTNTVGGYNCTCPVGKQLASDGLTCTECDPLHWGLNCENLCDCGIHVKACNKTDGCTICKDGWQDYNCVTDIDECRQNVCTEQEECFNTPGSYRCVVITTSVPTTEPATTVTPSKSAEVTTIREGTASDLTSQEGTPPTALPESTAAGTQPTARPESTATGTDIGSQATAVVTAPTTSSVVSSITFQLTLNISFSIGNTSEFQTNLLTTLSIIFIPTDGYVRIAILSVSEGSTIVRFLVLYDKNLAPANITAASLRFADYLKDLGNILAVGGVFVSVIDPQLITDAGNSTVISGVCFYYDFINACNTGTCYNNAGSPACRCPSSFSGEFCDSREELRGGLDEAEQAIVISCALAALLVLVFVALYFILKYKVRSRSSPRGSKSRTDSEITTTARTSEFSSTFSHSRFAPAYRGWWPAGWSTRWPFQYYYPETSVSSASDEVYSYDYRI